MRPLTIRMRFGVEPAGLRGKLRPPGIHYEFRAQDPFQHKPYRREITGLLHKLSRKKGMGSFC